MNANLQFNAQQQLRHFLHLDGLKRHHLMRIIELAQSFEYLPDKQVKKVPLLRGKIVTNLFFENSTRTRTTFELAAKLLSADVINFNVSVSATSKGETLLDTLRNLQAMHSDIFIVRHASSGAAHFIAQHVGEDISVINAGDGRHAHPTQALLDMFTIHKIKGDFAPLKIAIVGDILHSRVARSQIKALNILGVSEIRVIAPRTLLPPQVERMGVHPYYRIEEGLQGVDVIIMLRLQKERMSRALLPSEHEFYQLYGLNPERLKLAQPDAIVMHPGPINRGVEIASEVADGAQSVILDQVSNGIAIRMAIIALVAGAVGEPQ